MQLSQMIATMRATRASLAQGRGNHVSKDMAMRLLINYLPRIGRDEVVS